MRYAPGGRIGSNSMAERRGITLVRLIQIRLPVVLAFVAGAVLATVVTSLVAAVIHARSISAEAARFADDLDWVAELIENGDVGEDVLVVYSHFAALADRHGVEPTERFRRAGETLYLRAIQERDE